MNGLTKAEMTKLNEFRGAMIDALCIRLTDPGAVTRLKKEAARWSNRYPSRRGLRLSALRTIRGMYSHFEKGSEK